MNIYIYKSSHWPNLHNNSPIIMLFKNMVSPKPQSRKIYGLGFTKFMQPGPGKKFHKKGAADASVPSELPYAFR